MPAGFSPGYTPGSRRMGLELTVPVNFQLYLPDGKHNGLFEYRQRTYSCQAGEAVFRSEWYEVFTLCAYGMLYRSRYEGEEFDLTAKDYEFRPMLGLWQMYSMTCIT